MQSRVCSLLSPKRQHDVAFLSVPRPTLALPSSSLTLQLAPFPPMPSQPPSHRIYFTHHTACRAEDKTAALLFLVRELIPSHQPTVVFAATRHSVEFLVGLLEAEGIESAHVHGAMDQMARKIHIAKFRAGRVNLLVVTDVAARGLDIPLLDNVINYGEGPRECVRGVRVGRGPCSGREGAWTCGGPVPDPPHPNAPGFKLSLPLLSPTHPHPCRLPAQAQAVCAPDGACCSCREARHSLLLGHQVLSMGVGVRQHVSQDVLCMHSSNSMGLRLGPFFGAQPFPEVWPAA